jgi:ATP-dependent HslUV protease ATP-binding subunit HslU
METEGVTLAFTDDAVDAMAEFAFSVNEQTENIGARRLHTIMEKVLEDIAFEAPDIAEKGQKIDAEYVRRKLADIVKNQDLSRYIL